jgi:hypothetical protein
MINLNLSVISKGILSLNNLLKLASRPLTALLHLIQITEERATRLLSVSKKPIFRKADNQMQTKCLLFLPVMPLFGLLLGFSKA